MVKELTELVTLTEKTLPNHEELLAFLSGNNRDVLKLYHAFQSNSFRTEAEAIEKARIGERTKFRQVAKELMRCLEQMVLQVGFDKNILDDLTQNKIRGGQLIAITRSLSIMGGKNSSKKVAEELIRLGQLYGQPEFVVEATKSIMDFISVAGDDPHELESYVNLYYKYSEWRQMEEKSVIYYNLVKLPYTKKKSFQSEVAKVAEGYINELEPYVKVIESHVFHICYYTLKSQQFSIKSAYADASTTHDEAIGYFKSRSYPCNASLNIFYYLEIANCVYLGLYERGNEYLSNALQYAFVGGANWFNTLELGFYLRMHEKNYVGAAELYNTAIKHKRFNVLREAQREIWHILGAYLYIGIQLSGTVIPEDAVPRFKSSKFRNDIKDFARDKTGMNIAILAAEALLDFVEDKDDDLWNRIAAFEKYRERYLRDSEDTHRSQLFIKVLTILSKYNYDRDKFLEKAEPYLQELRESPLQLTNQAHELEIIPYEHLVQLVADTLSKRQGKAPRIIPFELPEKLRAATVCA